MNARSLAKRLRPAFAGGAVPTVRFGPDQYQWCGLETRTDPAVYDWPGARRGHGRHPMALWQYTIAGWGAFESGDGVTRRVPPGSMFAAVMPSNHRYYLPDESGSWTFVWTMFRHPYAVQRVRDRIGTSGPVTDMPADGPFVTKLISLLGAMRRAALADVFAWESALLDVTLEWERACEQRTYPQSPRERLLKDVRATVSRRMDEPVDVESLARAYDMSRSAFAHHFKATTGLAPGQFVTDVKLREVASRLRQSDDKLATIARACGFADANHLCKVFRRHYHASPGEYRRQFAAPATG